MMVPIPDHIRARRPELGLHWYVICDGAWNGTYAYVDLCPVGADIVVELAGLDGRQRQRRAPA